MCATISMTKTKSKNQRGENTLIVACWKQHDRSLFLVSVADAEWSVDQFAEMVASRFSLSFGLV